MPDEIKDTQPNLVKEDTQPNEAVPAQRKFPRLLAALVVVVVIAIGLLGGYGSGMGQRLAAERTLVSGQLEEQLLLGIQAMDAGEYERARQHFEFVIQKDPDFPGVQEAYTELLIRIQVSPTPTVTATPTITATPDLRSAEEKFNAAVALLSASVPNLCARDWDQVIATLDSLRKVDPTYRAAEVDGMYFTALHSRGLCKIYPQAYRPSAVCSDLGINLEGGIYDLTLAERFGPLDGRADGWRTWARFYITGASFWDQDWVQAQAFFSQVMGAMPNLMDSSCQTATERWRHTTIKYAEQLLAAGDVCGAEEQFAAAFAINSSQNEPYFATATQVANRCHPYVPPTPTLEETPAETPTDEETPEP